MTDKRIPAKHARRIKGQRLKRRVYGEWIEVFARYTHPDDSGVSRAVGAYQRTVVEGKPEFIERHSSHHWRRDGRRYRTLRDAIVDNSKPKKDAPEL